MNISRGKNVKIVMYEQKKLNSLNHSEIYQASNKLTIQ